IIRSGDDPEAVGRRAGHERVGGTPRADLTVEELAAQMAAQGFDPKIRNRETGVEIVLQRCPFETAALADADTVCALHLGMAEGMTDESPHSITELVRRDPRRANCLLRLGRPNDDVGTVTATVSRSPR
ncbi:MAG: hypothetical protein WBP59_04585, partial [Ilumatobacteraceae bacterium]